MTELWDVIATIATLIGVDSQALLGGICTALVLGAGKVGWWALKKSGRLGWRGGRATWAWLFVPVPVPPPPPEPIHEPSLLASALLSVISDEDNPSWEAFPRKADAGRTGRLFCGGTTFEFADGRLVSIKAGGSDSREDAIGHLDGKDLQLIRQAAAARALAWEEADRLRRNFTAVDDVIRARRKLEGSRADEPAYEPILPVAGHLSGTPAPTGPNGAERMPMESQTISLRQLLASRKATEKKGA